MISKKYKNGVKVFAPATIGNVGIGFDILGLAVEKWGDTLAIKPSSSRGINLKIIGDKGILPKDPKKNTATVPILGMMKELGIDPNIEVTLYKDLPIGSGLGSSAASAVAGAFAANQYFGAPYKKKELLKFALEGEEVATGVAHGDNVAPSLLGGLVLSRGIEANRVFTPDGLHLAIVHPEIQILTKDSRDILPKNIPLTLATEQWGNVAGFVLGMMKGDFDLIKNSLKDVIVEPARAKLIPGFYEIQRQALDAGALGCSISGAGPSIFAVCQNSIIAEKVGHLMRTVFDSLDIVSNTLISPINHEGVKIL